MKERVNSLEEATMWFLSHANGTVICVKENGTEKECGSYPEARDFYNN